MSDFERRFDELSEALALWSGEDEAKVRVVLMDAFTVSRESLRLFRVGLPKPPWWVPRFLWMRWFRSNAPAALDALQEHLDASD